jgi:hypothetical protein
MEQNSVAMRQMTQNRLAYDGTGKAVFYPLPPQYWEYDRANRRLEVQRTEAVRLLDALRAKAQLVKQQLPMPKYNNVQLVIGVEGTPAIPPVDAPNPLSAPAPVVVAPAAPETKVEGPANLLDEVTGGGAKPEAPKVAEKPLKY